MIVHNRHLGDANELAKEEGENLLELGVYHGPGIYFLCHGPLIIYIGQTTCLSARIGDHVRSKGMIFNRVFFVRCAYTDLNKMEGEYMARYMPAFSIFEKPPEYTVKNNTWMGGPTIKNCMPLFILDRLFREPKNDLRPLS